MYFTYQEGNLLSTTIQLYVNLICRDWCYFLHTLKLCDFKENIQIIKTNMKLH